MTHPQDPRQRVRISYAKGGALRYISHLDLARAWERAFRRAGLPIAYSRGFNPRPRLQIAAALPVGVTGRSELLDLWFVEPLLPEDVLDRLRPNLPPGLEVLGVEEVDIRAPSLQSQMRAADYRVLVQSQEPVPALRNRVGALLEESSVPRRRQHKGGWQTYDLRPLIQSIDVAPGGAGERILTMRLQASPQGAGRPDEVLDALGLSLSVQTMERTSLHLEFDK
jgi:radical SAM-linked protein